MKKVSSIWSHLDFRLGKFFFNINGIMVWNLVLIAGIGKFIVNSLTPDSASNN